MTDSKIINGFAMEDGGRRGGRSNRPGGLLTVFPALVLIFLIQLYRWTLSPALVFLFGANSGCRFTPTCSQYAREAIEQHGALHGSALAVKRICRCHPLGGCGHDPVPEAHEKGFIFHG